MRLALIGPVGVGKTSLSYALSFDLNLPKISLDSIISDYINSNLFLKLKIIFIRAFFGFWRTYRFVKPLELKILEKTLIDNNVGIFDLGGGHAVFEDPIMFSKLSTLLSSCSPVILLLPNEDREESIKWLREKNSYLKNISPCINKYLLQSGCYEKLANITIFVKDKEQNVLVNEIKQKIYNY